MGKTNYINRVNTLLNDNFNRLITAFRLRKTLVDGYDDIMEDVNELSKIKTFNTLAELQTYVSTNPTAYAGQQCVVKGIKSIVYTINSDNSLTPHATKDELNNKHNIITGGYKSGGFILPRPQETMPTPLGYRLAQIYLPKKYFDDRYRITLKLSMVAYPVISPSNNTFGSRINCNIQPFYRYEYNNGIIEQNVIDHINIDFAKKYYEGNSQPTSSDNYYFYCSKINLYYKFENSPKYRGTEEEASVVADYTDHEFKIDFFADNPVYLDTKQSGHGDGRYIGTSSNAKDDIMFGFYIRPLYHKFDFNEDGVVDSKDIAELTSKIGSVLSEDLLKYDLNNDGIIDIKDVDIITDWANAELTLPRYDKLHFLDFYAEIISKEDNTIYDRYDLNGDGRVDSDDLDLLSRYYGNTDPDILLAFDLNNDGVIDGSDYNILDNYINSLT